MGRSRYIFGESDQPHLITCTTIKWLPIFNRPEAVEIILDSLTFLQSNGRLVLYGYVVLENHLHLVASSDHLSKEIGDFKSFTARRIIDLLKAKNEKNLLMLLEAHKTKHKKDRRYQLWQEGSHPKAILDEEMMRQKLEYIHNNPMKRGYVDEPIHWRYSSARNYEEESGLIQVTTEWY